MAVFKPKIKETTEDRLQKAIDLGRREALKEVLKWLKEKTYTIYYRGGSEAFNINFESEEEMLQSFKERFNIVDDCDQQYPSDFINDDNYDCK